MTTETFTDEGEWTVPDDVERVLVELEGQAGESGSTDAGGQGGFAAGFLLTEGGESFQVGLTTGGGGITGGGAIDIRDGPGLDDRLAVGAGGGGAGEETSASRNATGGDGGPLEGEDGSGGGGGSSGGGGGTQTDGGEAGSGREGDDGEFGSGGSGGSGRGIRGGGGGGGWYGGGGGSVSDQGFTQAAGGGGGSNYVDGFDTIVANERGGSARSFTAGPRLTVAYATTPTLDDIVANDDGSVGLSWSDESETKYNVYRSSTPGSDFEDYELVETTSSTTLTDAPGEGQTWYYRVSAESDGAESTLSNEETVTAILPAPTEVSVSNVGTGSVDIQWTLNSTDEDRVVVEISTDGGETWMELVLLDSGTESFEATGLLNGQSYFVRVVVEVDE